MSPTYSITHEIRNDFGVPFTHRLLFDRAVLNPENPLLHTVFECRTDGAPRSGIIAVVDQGLANAQPDLQAALTKRFSDPSLPELREVLLVPGGEACKNDPAVTDRILAAIEKTSDRPAVLRRRLRRRCGPRRRRVRAPAPPTAAVASDSLPHHRPRHSSTPRSG